MNLKKISKEINDILKNRRDELNLTFEESEHKYTMKDLDGNLRSDFPSVSTVLKSFYTEFDKEAKATQKSKGDESIKIQLLNEWAAAGDYATNMGSRVHYHLEIKTLDAYNVSKEVRKPIFECDEVQEERGDKMIEAGIAFIELMKKRKAELLDTEIVLGDPELGYTGQPDKCWIMLNQNKELGFVITDWKTNAKKNFERQWYTIPMLEPFEYLDDTALSHYYLQLPLYAKLLLKMLQGSKYENIKFFGAVVVRLEDDGTFEEYRVPQKVINKILEMDVKSYLKGK